MAGLCTEYSRGGYWFDIFRRLCLREEIVRCLGRIFTRKFKRKWDGEIKWIIGLSFNLKRPKPIILALQSIDNCL